VIGESRARRQAQLRVALAHSFVRHLFISPYAPFEDDSSLIYQLGDEHRTAFGAVICCLLEQIVNTISVDDAPPLKELTSKMQELCTVKEAYRWYLHAVKTYWPSRNHWYNPLSPQGFWEIVCRLHVWQLLIVPTAIVDWTAFPPKPKTQADWSGMWDTIRKTSPDVQVCSLHLRVVADLHYFVHLLCMDVTPLGMTAQELMSVLVERLFGVLDGRSSIWVETDKV
jgi:hypothetical protein